MLDPHQHKFWKNGINTAGNQQWRCKCGVTKTDGIDGRGAPRKHENSNDRFKQVERKHAMKTYKFKSYHAYTNHLGADHEAIEASCYSEFPSWVVLPNGDKLDPISECNYAETVTSAGYAVIKKNGWEVRIRKSYDRSPNYSSGTHGTSKGLMEVRSASPLIFIPDQDVGEA